MKIKYLFPILISIVVLGCKKGDSEPETEYDYKIARGMYVNGTWTDSLTYYYNSDNRLVKVDKFVSPYQYTDYNVTYYPEYIDNWNGDYFFDAEHKITVINNSGYIIEFEYESNNRIAERHSIDGFVFQEVFYSYLDDNLLRDSTIVQNENDTAAHITVNSYLYTDTLRPGIMVDYSGLHEILPSSKKLIKEVHSISYTDTVADESVTKYKYYYYLTDDVAVQYVNAYKKDDEDDTLVGNWTIVFSIANKE